MFRTLTWRKVAAWRVARQHLDRRAPAGGALAVASRLCGLHAQVMSSAELTLWARVEDLDRGTVERALWKQRTLVKMWAMRGTLHLLPAAELALWHAGLGMNPRYLRERVWKKHFGLSLADLDRVTEMIATVLDGRLVTREDLAREVGRLSGSASLGAKIAESSWGTVLRPASFRGRLCFGPSLGQRVRFTRPDTWLTGKRARALGQKIDPQAAAAEITRRFLGVYGPATYHDLARWWGGGGVAAARRWIAALGDEVSAVDLEGTRAWMLSAHAREVLAISPGRSVRLLPAFDQYVVGASRHAQHLLPGDLRARVYRAQGWLSPVLLVNGLMHGVWRHEVKGSRVEVVIQPFVQIPAWARRGAEQEAERLARFLGCALQLAWKS